MTRKAFINATAVLEEEVLSDAAVITLNGKITFVGKASDAKPDGAEIHDLGGKLLLPGFVDTHIHGGGGADFMDLTEESFETAVRTHALHGTTSICPTAVASELEKLGRLCDIYRLMEKKKLPATLLGLHLEGPFLSLKNSGAQNRSRIMLPTRERVDYLLEKGRGIIKRIGIAPENEGAYEAAERFAEADALVSIAHTDATFDIAREAVKHGFSHVTHLFCATPALRKINEVVRAGVVEAAYLMDELSYELIGDGLHIPPETVEIAARIKPRLSVSLVTDAMRAAGQDVTESYLGEVQPDNRVIVEGGVAKLPDKSSFAGSIATSDLVFGNVRKNTPLSLPKICEMMCLAPAKSVGADGFKGSIAEGKDADLIVLSENGYDIEEVYSMGMKIV